MPRWMWGMIPVGIAGYALHFTGTPEWLLFVLCIAGLIPLAALIGVATEELAYRVGPTAGGLLNVTFGNVPELIIGILAIRQGLFTLTQATIVGSIIGNASLVTGMSLVWGGVRHGTQRFDRTQVGHHTVLLVLAVAALALPTIFNASQPGNNVQGVSVLAGVVLVLAYATFLLFDLAGWHGGNPPERGTGLLDDTTAAVDDLVESEGGPTWSTRLGIFWLAFASLWVALEGDVVVAAVRPVTQTLHISEFFVGLVIIPIVGNVAEHWSAVQLAGRNKLDLSFAIATGSAIQVAAFVGPTLVFLSFLWHPLPLVFHPLELAVLALTVVMFAFAARDGESNWLVGMQMVLLYVLAAGIFFFVPSPAAL